MERRILGVLSIILVILMAGGFPLQVQSRDAKALLDEAAGFLYTCREGAAHGVARQFREEQTRGDY